MKYEMHLRDSLFNKTKNGTKNIELRLNDEKRQQLKDNDIIEFINIKTLEKLLVKVERIYKYSSFEELYKDFDKVSMGYDKYEVANPKDLEKYYSKEEQEKYGVLGIKIKLI